MLLRPLTMRFPLDGRAVSFRRSRRLGLSNGSSRANRGSMSESMSQPRVGVASRILALLAVFDTTHRRLSLTEMACRAELPLSTVHRMVAELEGWGALSRQPCGGYVIGRRLWDVGLLAPVPTGLLEVASPFLHDLYGATLATVHLAVRDGLQALCLARLAGHASVPVVSRIGSRLPL